MGDRPTSFSKGVKYLFPYKGIGFKDIDDLRKKFKYHKGDKRVIVKNKAGKDVAFKPNTIDKLFDMIQTKADKEEAKIHKMVREAEESGTVDKAKRIKVRDKVQKIADKATKEINRDFKLIKHYGVDAMKAKSFAADASTKSKKKQKKHLLERKKKLSKFDFGA